MHEKRCVRWQAERGSVSEGWVECLCQRVGTLREGVLYLITHGHAIIYLQTDLRPFPHGLAVAPGVALAPHHIHLALALVISGPEEAGKGSTGDKG